MASPFYFDVNGDFQGNQLLNAVLEQETDGTGLTIEGQIGYNTTDHLPQYRNATVVLQLASLTGTETLTNKTLTSPVVNTGVSGTAIRKLSDGGIRAATSALETLVPSEKAVASAIEALIGTANAMVYKGGQTGVGNPNYPAADAGWTYNITAAGKIGGASGVVVEAGDMITCTTDGTASGDQATVGANWVVVQSNIDIVPVSKGGLGANLTTSAAIGDILWADSTTTFARIAKGTVNHVLTMTGASTVGWAALPTITPAALTTGSADTNIIITLGGSPSTALLYAASITMSWSGTLAVTRGGTGQSSALVAGGIIYGASTTAMGCTAIGTAGAHLQSAAGAAPTWTSVTYPSTAAQGDILYCSATNVYSHLAKSGTANSFLKNSGSSNNPAWATLALTDLPNGVQKFYKALYEATGAATTSINVSAATHGMATPWNLSVQFYRENGTTYIPAAASITINKTTGEVIVATQTAQKGYVIIGQVLGSL